jgi:hypothetical protein
VNRNRLCLAAANCARNRSRVAFQSDHVRVRSPKYGKDGRGGWGCTGGMQLEGKDVSQEIQGNERREATIQQRRRGERKKGGHDLDIEHG